MEEGLGSVSFLWVLSVPLNGIFLYKYQNPKLVGIGQWPSKLDVYFLVSTLAWAIGVMAFRFPQGVRDVTVMLLRGCRFPFPFVVLDTLAMLIPVAHLFTLHQLFHEKAAAACH